MLILFLLSFIDAAEAMSPIIKYNTISEEQLTVVEENQIKGQSIPSYLLAQTGESK